MNDERFEAILTIAMWLFMAVIVINLVAVIVLAVIDPGAIPFGSNP